MKGFLKIYLLLYFLGVISIGCKEITETQEAKETLNTTKAPFNPDLHFKSYDVNDGLISTDLLNVYNDHKGFTWVATGKGIVKYDGHTFKSYLSDLERGVYLDGASYFYEDSKGVFWILSGNGFLHQYNPETDTVENIPTKLENGWSTESPLRIFEDSLSNLWIGGYGGLQYWDRRTGNIEVFPISKIRNEYWLQAEKVRIEVIQKDKNGNLWLGTRKFGLVKFDLSTKEYSFLRDQKQYRNITLDDWITDIIPADKGNFWIADYNVGLVLYNPIKEEIIKTKDFREFSGRRPNIYIRDILKEGQLLILGTERSGMITYDPSSENVTHNYQNVPEIIGNHIRRLVLDKRANLWLVGERLVHGTSEKSRFDTFKLPDEVKNPEVYAVASNDEGEILISTTKHTVYHDASSNTTTSHSYLSPAATRNYSVLINSEGVKYTSDEHQIVAFDPKDNSILKKYDTHMILDTVQNTLRRALRFLESSDKTIWTMDHWGRLKYIKKDSIGNVFALAQDKASKRFINVYCFIDDPENERILVGTSMGLASVSYDLQNINWVPIEASTINISRSSFTFLYKDKSDELWALVEGQLYQLNLEENTAKPFTEIPSLQRVNWVIEEPKGTLWLHTGKEVLRFNRRTKQVTSFENTNFSEGSFKKPSPVVTSQGKIYFGGQNGVSIIDPQKLGHNPNPPDLYLTKFSFPVKQGDGNVKDTVINIVDQQKMELSYFQNDLTFFYTGIEYKNPKLSQYKFILDGYDTDWVEVGSQPYAIYTNISPGNYTFKVMAANSDGVWTKEPVTMEVLVKPPWWQTWWAYVCYVILVAGLIYSWIRYQVYQKTLKYKTNEKLRTRISSDLHDEVGTILSGLSMKSELMSLTAPQKEQQELTKLSEMSKDAMERMRDTVWAIDSRKDNYENLFDKMKEYAQENLSLKNIGFQFNTEKLNNTAFISPEKRQNTYLIFKEAVANIMKHSDATLVKIDAALNGDQFELSIVDNGNLQQSKISAGQGTSNMQMRAKKIGGNLNTKYANGFRVELTYPVSD